MGVALGFFWGHFLLPKGCRETLRRSVPGWDTGWDEVSPLRVWRQQQLQHRLRELQSPGTATAAKGPENVVFYAKQRSEGEREEEDVLTAGPMDGFRWGPAAQE